MGEEAEIYAFKGCKVGDFGGRTLSVGSQASISANPDIPEAHSLRGWSVSPILLVSSGATADAFRRRYDQQGSTVKFTSFAGTGGGSNAPMKYEDFRTIQAVKEEGLGTVDDKVDYFNLRATINFTKSEGYSYPACPGDKCSKKLIQEDDFQWKCEKCDKIYETPEYRSVLPSLFVESSHHVSS